MTDNNDDILVKNSSAKTALMCPTTDSQSVSCAVCPTAHGVSAVCGQLYALL